MLKRKYLLQLVAWVLLVSFPQLLIASNESQADQIEIEDAWIRKSYSTFNSSAYMTIKNNSDNTLYIKYITAPLVSNKCILMQNFFEAASNIIKTINIDTLAIPGKSEIKLEPLGMYIMLFGLKTNLILNNKYSLSIKFSDSSIKTVQAIVKDM